MGALKPVSQEDMVKLLRCFVDQVESGEVEVNNIAVTQVTCEGPPENGFRTNRPTSFRTMEIAYWQSATGRIDPPILEVN